MRHVTMAAILGLSLLAPGLAGAVEPCAPDPRMTASDARRLADLGASRLRGLGAAMAEGDAADRALVGALYAEGLAPAGTIEPGAYECRTIKLGGLLPLVVYGAFTCEIRATGEGGYDIVKPTGSQQLSGTLTPAGEGLLYLGALNYSDEPPIAYASMPDRDQVGCLYRVAPDDPRLVLELPAPQFESAFDILLLSPR